MLGAARVWPRRRRVARQGWQVNVPLSISAGGWPKFIICDSFPTMSGATQTCRRWVERSAPRGKCMRSRPITLLCIAVLLSLTAAAAPPARRETLAGKSVQMIIGFGPGGDYDLWGRTVARHIGRHLPGHPAVIAQNMPGAGSYTAASYIFNIAPKDGTVLGIIARDAALGPLSGATGARFDATKLSWIGTPTKETNVCIAYHTAQVQSVADLFDKQLIVGETGPGTGTRSYPKAQRVDRNEIQAGRRISGVLRRVPGHGTRRSRGDLREPRQHPYPAARLDSNKESFDS